MKPGRRLVPWFLVATLLGAFGLARPVSGQIPGAGSAPDASGPTGHWTTTIDTQNGPAELILDIGRIGPRWAGEFDLPAFGVENYPVTVAVTGDSVRLVFSAMPATYEGRLSEDRGRLAGSTLFEGDPEPAAMDFERQGDVAFSPMFLELEAAATDSSLVRVIDDGGQDLREAFNRAADRVRLVLLLSPTCPGCQRGAREVERRVLETIEGADLAVFAVWEPILPSDEERAARKATLLLPDGRVRHFWTAAQEIGRLFRDPIGLEGEPAWDVYLLYPKDATWGDDPPRPGYFMHQLRGRLPESLVLNADTLAVKVRAFLDR